MVLLDHKTFGMLFGKIEGIRLVTLPIVQTCEEYLRMLSHPALARHSHNSFQVFRHPDKLLSFCQFWRDALFLVMLL